MTEKVFIINEKTVKDAYLVGIKDSSFDAKDAIEHLSELKELVRTMGLNIVGSEIVHLRVPNPNPRFFIGSGKVQEITSAAKIKNAQCIIVDFELSPSQQRNWEKETGLCVIDRQEVILEIFAARAITKEAIIQVALAQMEYSLPRLKRAWTHLSRQRGGVSGTRGEGEKQLEADRRIVLDRISQLKKELKEVSKHRDTQRRKREKSSIPLGVIVGYTNVGKSSLLNCLSGSNAFVEDKLFATLDPTTRIVELPEKQKIILSDTVGFIRKLPHQLIEAFKSTLEEALVANFIIHVLDASSDCIEVHRKTTIDLLIELGITDTPIITVYNKVDKIKGEDKEYRLKLEHPKAIFTSTKTGEGIEELKQKLLSQLNFDTEESLAKLAINFL